MVQGSGSIPLHATNQKSDADYNRHEHTMSTKTSETVYFSHAQIMAIEAGIKDLSIDGFENDSITIHNKGEEHGSWIEVEPSTARYLIQLGMKACKHLYPNAFDENVPVFTNGFRKWMETHHEIVSFIAGRLAVTEDTEVHRTSYGHGTNGLYELALDWTNEFETKHKGHDWDGDDFWDVIEAFCTEKNNVQG